MVSDDFEGSIRYYRPIATVLFVSLAVCMGMLVVLNINRVATWLAEVLGQRKAFVIELYFWAALGATVASYKFFAQDKDVNELEAAKEEPDPAVLRYPNALDVVLYVQRILFSGVLGVVGAVILFAGLGYFDASFDNWGFKQEMFFIVFCFLIGIYQNDFLAFLSELNKKLFQRRPQRESLSGGDPGTS